MATPYSGSLQRKTKADLQEIALALSLSDTGTKDDIHQRIKRHLEENIDELEVDPIFSGLYTRKRRPGSVQPMFTNGFTTATHQYESIQEETEKERDMSPPTATEGVKTVLNVDARDVSMMIPHAPASPSPSTTVRSSPRVGRRVSPGPSYTSSPVISAAYTQAYLQQQQQQQQQLQQQQQQQQLLQHLAGLLSAPASPAAPPAPAQAPPASASVPPSPEKSIVAEALEQPEVREAVQMHHTFIRNALATYALVRTVLSNGRNLFVLSGLIDALTILFTVHSSGINSFSSASLQTSVLALTHWAMPTIILPVVLGHLVSFSSMTPTSTTATSSTETQSEAAPPASPYTFDTLSAAIVKAAASAAYPFPPVLVVGAANELQSLDILGSKWRGVSAGVTLAFAFAEAIAAGGSRG